MNLLDEMQNLQDEPFIFTVAGISSLNAGQMNSFRINVVSGFPFEGGRKSQGLKVLSPPPGKKCVTANRSSNSKVMKGLFFNSIFQCQVQDRKILL